MNINYKESDRRKAFLANPKHQCFASQWEDHDCSEHNKKNVDDCSENPYLSNSWMNISYKENGGKKSFS